VCECTPVHVNVISLLALFLFGHDLASQARSRPAQSYMDWQKSCMRMVYNQVIAHTTICPNTIIYGVTCPNAIIYGLTCPNAIIFGLTCPNAIIYGLTCPITIIYGAHTSLPNSSHVPLYAKGFLRVSAGGRSPFSTVRKDLDLIMPDEGDELEGLQGGGASPAHTLQHNHALKDVSHLYKVCTAGAYCRENYSELHTYTHTHTAA